MIYVIIGPTGVGKTKLSIELAKKLNAIIINADSMQIYKELNIGTAKIKDGEMQGIPHYMLNIKSITEDFNAFLYQQMAREIIENNKCKNIIIVGGTGLYIKALLYNYNFDNENKKCEPIYNFKMVGLTRSRSSLYEVINNRVDEMIEDGLIEEAKDLYDKKINSRALNTAIGYKELFEYFRGDTIKELAIDKIKQNSRHYAKRQYTFFNNQFDNILWYDIEKKTFKEIVNEIAI